MAKLQSYKSLISKSQQEIQSEELDLKVQEAKSSLEITVSTTKRDLAVAKKEFSKTQSACPYDILSEIQAKQRVESLEAGLAYAEKVLKERFSNDDENAAA